MFDALLSLQARWKSQTPQTRGFIFVTAICVLFLLITTIYPFYHVCTYRSPV